MSNNVENFLIEFQFADKKAIKQLKQFFKKIETVNKNLNKNLANHLEKGEVQRHNKRQKLEDAHVKARMQHEKDLALQQKQNEKKRIADARKRLALEKQISAQRRRMLYSQNFSSLTPDKQAYFRQTAKDIGASAMKSGDTERMKDQFAKLNSELRNTAREMRNVRRNALGLSIAQNGLKDSTRHLIRSYASLFALIEGTTAINKIGQDFEGMRASMLAASGGLEQAGKDLAFVREESVRLGTDLRMSTDAFVKLQFAAKDQMSNKDTRALFTGFSEFATALQIDKFRYEKGLMALNQMMNKSQIMAEELKNQLNQGLTEVQLAA